MRVLKVCCAMGSQPLKSSAHWTCRVVHVLSVCTLCDEKMYNGLHMCYGNLLMCCVQCGVIYTAKVYCAQCAETGWCWVICAGCCVWCAVSSVLKLVYCVQCQSVQCAETGRCWGKWAVVGTIITCLRWHRPEMCNVPHFISFPCSSLLKIS